MGKKTIGEQIFDTTNHIFMVLIAIVTLYPMMYVLFSSLSDPKLLIQHRGVLIFPKGFDLGSYKMVFNDPMIVRGFLNTLFVVLFGVPYNLMLTMLGAYFLSRRNLMFKNYFLILVLIPMYINGGLIPFFFTVKQLGMYNSLWALIIPTGLNTTNLIIMRTNFMSIPRSLEESAKIDGGNDFVILFKIIIPLCIPVIAVMILFYGVSKWNTWFQAAIFIQDRNKFPLPLVLRQILVQNSTDIMTSDVVISAKSLYQDTVKYATIIVASLPIICAYPYLQKFFVKGMLIGSIKG